MEKSRRISALHAQLSTPNFPMKSAYELAMDRLEKKSPTVTLTEKQKAEIAEIEVTFKAKIAEREVFLQDQIAKARFEDKAGEVLELEDQLTRELRRLQQDCEDKKAKVRPK